MSHRDPRRHNRLDDVTLLPAAQPRRRPAYLCRRHARLRACALRLHRLCQVGDVTDGDVIFCGLLITEL